MSYAILGEGLYFGALGSIDHVFTPFIQMWLWSLDNEPHTKLSLFIFMFMGTHAIVHSTLWLFKPQNIDHWSS